MKAKEGSGGTAPPILNLGTRWKLPIPTEEKAGWAPVALWTLQRRNEFLALVGIRSPDH